MIVVLDTGGVSALTPDDERGRARLRSVRNRASDLVVPAAVLAEGVLTGHPGRDYHVQRLLALVDVAEVDEQLGLAAGALRTQTIKDGADPPPSGVDAIVAAAADTLAANTAVEIITSDHDDILSLVVFGDHTPRLSITPV